MAPSWQEPRGYHTFPVNKDVVRIIDLPDLMSDAAWFAFCSSSSLKQQLLAATAAAAASCTAVFFD